MSTKVKALFQLLRVRQYYKNLVLFIGVFFAGEIFNVNLYLQLVLAFVLVCLASSLMYIVNDIRDKEADKVHPEKAKSRPLANGDLSVGFAWILLIVIAGVEIFFIIYYRNLFSAFLGLIIANGLAYNFLFKDIAFADIISLSTIYLWRALAGCAMIDVRISPWLVISVFLLAMLLAAGKRIADLELLGEHKAVQHKKSYDKYSQHLLDYIIVMIATSLFIMYTLYCVLGPLEDGSIVPKENQGLLIYSTPVALFLIIRFLYLVRAKPKIARNAEKMITDLPMLVGGVFLGIMVLILYYLEIT